MNIDELKQFSFGFEEKITITAYFIPPFPETQKATVIFITQPDKRRNKYNIVVKLYRCQNTTNIDIDDIVSISKGWD